MFMSLPFTPRTVKATEARLQRVYNGAQLGLKGDKLATFAGMLPVEYNQLKQLDPIVELAELKGRTDAEAEAASVMRTAALSGDAKAALAILQHRHDWTAKQEVVNTTYQVDIKGLLEIREQRLRELAPPRQPLTIDQVPTYAEREEFANP